MLDRILGKSLLDLAGWFPVVSVTGPRQSGKSTLVQATFPEYRYVNLEDPALRARANTDPKGFVEALPERVVIDEAQYAPELFSAIQVKADERKRAGQFVLSGSQNFLLLGKIRQSLAGRVGIARLLPLEFREVLGGRPDADPLDVMLRGSYPALHVSDVPASVFFQSYIDTYVTRDVVGYLDVRNEREYRSFLSACAVRSGNLLNYSDLARDVGVSFPTVKSWLSILESSYIAYTLPSFHANISKRLAKAPKLYFHDTGLLCHLLGLRSHDDLLNSPHLGAVFENYVISERMKQRFNALRNADLFFYRDDSKVEVDLIDRPAEGDGAICEIKAGMTYRHAFARSVAKVAPVIGRPGDERLVVYGGEGAFQDGDVSVMGVREWLLR